MNAEMLNVLLLALAQSPDNVILRRQVVEGLVDAGRWNEVMEQAPPLEAAADYRAYANLAMARAAHGLADTQRACLLYQKAITLDSTLQDEALEAEIMPGEMMALPAGDFEFPGEQLRPYAGPRISFADIGGMEELKEQIRMQIIYPFQHPEIFAAYGKKVGGGILMFGPPGCGKTHIARATAGELGANFYPLELNDILSLWMGESEKQLNLLFETARANAPSVIFIDEVDALGVKRSEVRNSALRTAVTQLLTEMDGIQAQNSQVLILGATNEPWTLDSAFRRPGRFDRILFVTPPDQSAREEILRLHSRNRKIDPKLCWRTLAEKTAFFSGADIAALIDQSCESALTDAMKHGNFRDVTMQDFAKALRTMRPSTTEWLRRARNYVTYANQDGYYDTLARYLDEHKLK